MIFFLISILETSENGSEFEMSTALLKFFEIHCRASRQNDCRKLRNRIDNLKKKIGNFLKLES
jgi:hypothetical protein